MSASSPIGVGATPAGGSAGSAGPNLARRPFVNARPVTRLALLLWLLGLGLLIANVFSVSAYLVGSAQKRERLAALEIEITTESGRSAELVRELAGMDLEELNDRVAFLNRRIAERTFTWGRLFDDISEVLPRDVRIVGISPLSIARDERGRARAAGSARTDADDEAVPEFALAINGVARSAEQLLDFIDALFARPDFAHPDLASEEAAADGLAFNATAVYRPRRDGAATGAVLEEVAAPELTIDPADRLAAPPAASADDAGTGDEL